MLDIIVTYMLDGEETETTVSFGRATDEILNGEYDGPCAEELEKLWSRRSAQEWYDYIYDRAVEMCTGLFFKRGIIPSDLRPKRFVPASDVVGVRFPDGLELTGPHNQFPGEAR